MKKVATNPKLHQMDKGKKKVKSKEKINESIERKEKSSQFQQLDIASITLFSELPLSERTLKGLSNASFMKPTDIQKEGIALALQGRDVLGAAKTGSGKTLAFIVPILEMLWHECWANTDGLGALVISPTRELALQTYEVLHKIGRYHDFSAGLIIGGKDLQEEQQRIPNTNIIIGTPGRILQHFDETPNFGSFNLKLLVLDEADRILDLGFASAVNAIIENLPEERQTLLYSATQTKSVKDLARLSLKNPDYINVHEGSKYCTPKKLIQNYIFVELHQKIDFLYSFIRNHLKSKCIVFLSSCKQVKFVSEVFRKLRPGIPLNALYGKQKQLKRVAIFNRFCTIQYAVLFATDIAARGLDFPAVNWVIQYDCPENPDTYIHRVGRTARFEKGGQALMMLLPSEGEMVKKITNRKVPIHELKSNPKKIRSIHGKLQSFCIQDQQIKDWAQKSIISYARSVYLQSDKTVFDVTKLPLDKFSLSHGLVAAPKLQFLKKKFKQMGPADESSSYQDIKEKIELKFDNQEDVDNETIGNYICSDGDDEDDVLVKKTDNLHHDNIGEEKPNETKTVRKRTTKVKIAKTVLNKNIGVGNKIIFDKDYDFEKSIEDIPGSIAEVEDDGINGIDIAQAKKYLKEQDRTDYEEEKKRIRLKRRELKRKRKGEKEESMTVELKMSDEEIDSAADGDISEDGGISRGKQLCSREEKLEDEDLVQKRAKINEKSKVHDVLSKDISSIEDDEGLVLHLLGIS